MKIAPYVEKLNNSQEYQKFAKKNKDAFMIAGFFILDFENGNHIHQIDYYVPSQKKVAAFTLDRSVTLQMLSMLTGKQPEKLDIKTKTDLDALKGILEDEMKNRSITEEIKKIIAVLHTVDGKKIWNLNCVLSGMSILKANVEDSTQSILKMEKASIFDYIKKIPGAQLAQMQGGMQGMQQPTQPSTPPAQQGSPSMPQVPVPEQIEEEIKKLDKLEQAIEQEKTELKKQLSKTDKKKDVKSPSSDIKKTSQKNKK